MAQQKKSMAGREQARNRREIARNETQKRSVIFRKENLLKPAISGIWQRVFPCFFDKRQQ